MAHEIKLYDVIGGWGITAQEFTDAIPADATDITVRINSPGGAVGEGLAIYNYLKDHKARVTTIVDGYAASMASVIMLAGDIVKVHEGSIVMVHNPWMTTAGNAEELRKSADDLEVHGDAIKAIYARETELSGDKIDALMAGETYLIGSDALELGFADALVENETPQQAAAYQAFAAMLKPLIEGNTMSKVETRKDIAAKRDELQAKVDELTAAAERGAQEHAGEIEALNVEMQSKLDEAQAQIEAKDAEIAAVTEKVGDQAEIIVSSTEDLEAARADLDVKSGELATALEALKNPAVKDAQLDDDGEPAPNAQDTEADEAEAEAAQDKPDEPKNVYEQYKAIEDTDERRAFLADNKRAIYAAMEQGE